VSRSPVRVRVLACAPGDSLVTGVQGYVKVMSKWSNRTAEQDFGKRD
jgi:hypothetical protein